MKVALITVLASLSLSLAACEKEKAVPEKQDAAATMPPGSPGAANSGGSPVNAPGNGW